MANIFTSYSCSVTTKNGKHLYFHYFLQLFGYDEEQQTSLLPIAGLLRRRTANIFTSYSWSVTTKNGKHLYFLQLVCCDCGAEEEGPWLPVIWTAGSFRLGPVTTNRGRGRGEWAGAMGHVLWMAAFLILSSINSQLSWLRGWRKIRMSLRERERERDRQTERQRDRETERDRDRGVRQFQRTSGTQCMYIHVYYQINAVANLFS